MSLMKLQPALKDYLWGGTKLISEYGKNTNLLKVAESWEISTHPAGSSVIANGPFAGESLRSFIEKQGSDCLGDNNKHLTELPVLVKLIDAQADLSIQVHPDDDYSYQHENQPGKTEMWYILKTEPTARLYYGFNQTLTTMEMKEKIQDGSLIEALNEVPIKPADVVFVPAKTVHAIGQGTLLCEIQQSSNVTYRVYDFKRVGPDGKPRELHIKQALAVSDTNQLTPTFIQPTLIEKTSDFQLELLVDCAYFKVSRLTLAGEYTLKTNHQSFYGLVVISGEITVDQTLNLMKGESGFLPAHSPACKLAGQAEILIISK